MGAVFRTALRAPPVVLACVLLGSYAYFYQGGGWNQNTRFDLVRAIVERGTLQIDLYADNTGDKAELGGHVYSDKAPGASLTAVPAVAVARALFRAAGRDVYAPEAIADLSYVATVAAAALPTVFAALAVYGVVRRLGAGDGAATVAALTCGLATPLWAYATLLYGHALAAGCLAVAFLAAIRVGNGGGSAASGWALVTGAAAGWAVVTEFPASIPSALIVAFACWRAFELARTQRMRVVRAIAVGLAIGAVILMAYNWLAFGSAFHIAYSSEQGYEAMRTGIFGVNWPRPRVALSLLFGSYRGLIPLAPALVAAPFGFWILARNRNTRIVGLLALAIAAYYFLMTSGYAYWDGGWSYGSRHLGPALPFACIGIGAAWQAAGRVARAGILVLAIVGATESLVAVATTPQPPGGQTAPANPMRELLWPAFVSGDFPIGWQSVLELRAPAEPPSELARRGVPRASWNLGQRVGLRGHASLVPLLLIWIAGAVWRRRSRWSPGPSGPGSSAL